MVNEEYNKGFTKRDFLKKGGKASLSLGVGITLLRKPQALDHGWMREKYCSKLTESVVEYASEGSAL